MKKSYFLSSLILLSFVFNVNSQINSSSSENTLSKSMEINTLTDSLNLENSTDTNKQNQTFLKTNLLGIAINNYSFQIERTLSKKISLALSYRIMPNGSIPFKSKIIDAVGTEDPDTQETIENMKIGNYAITPEIRFYLSKNGYGKGFYIAPFYRYAQYEITEMLFKFIDITNPNSDQSINLSGKVTSNTGGVLFGTQWFIGKNLSIDWWILGAHYGNANGSFDGKSSRALNSIEQNELRQQLEDIDIPLTDKTVEVNANGASLKIDGPWAGLRTGLSIGYRF